MAEVVDAMHFHGDREERVRPRAAPVQVGRSRYEELRRTVGGTSMNIVVNGIYTASVDVEDLMDDEEVL